MKLKDKLIEMMRGFSAKAHTCNLDSYQENIFDQKMREIQIAQQQHIHSHTLPGGFPNSSWTANSTITFPSSLTNSEEAELKVLEDECKQRTKTAKLNHFKNLPKETRQYIINDIVWNRTITEINEIEEESVRLSELRSKKQNGNVFINSMNFGGLGSYQHHNKPILPEGLTEEDLIHAHLAATIDEEIAGE